MHIVNHKLVGPNVTFRHAQSFGGRLTRPTAVCLHDTAGSLKKFSSVKWFESPECGTSAHVVVELDGTVTQMVPFDIIAYHAGRSSWKGKPECNKYMIGIEIVSPGMMVRRGDEAQLIYKSTDKTGRIVDKVVERFPLAKCQEVNTKEHGKGWVLPYTDAQIATVTEICRLLAETYDSIEEIVTHWLISPGRKVDTTPALPLDQIRKGAFHPDKIAALPPAPPPPEPAPLPETTKPPSVVKAGFESKTVFAILFGGAVEVARQFKEWVNDGLDWIMWGIGILPDVTNEVKTTLSNGELMAGWLKLNWPKMAVYVTIGCLAIAVIRHINDKRKLAQAQQQP